MGLTKKLDCLSLSSSPIPPNRNPVTVSSSAMTDISLPMAILKFSKNYFGFLLIHPVGEFWRRLNCFIQRVITMSHHLLWVNEPWVVPPFAIVDFCFTLPKFGSVKPPGAAGWPPPFPFLLFFFTFLKMVGSRIFYQKSKKSSSKNVRRLNGP